MLKNLEILAEEQKNLGFELYFAFGKITILAFCPYFPSFSLKNHFEIYKTKKYRFNLFNFLKFDFEKKLVSSINNPSKLIKFDLELFLKIIRLSKDFWQSKN